MTLPTDKLEPGMELAADVLNPNKILLLGKGTVLTERHLRTLATWGVETVSVAQSGPAGNDSPAQADLAPEILAEAERRVMRRFRHANANNKLVKLVKELAVARLARRLAQRETGANAPPPSG